VGVHLHTQAGRVDNLDDAVCEVSLKFVTKVITNLFNIFKTIIELMVCLKADIFEFFIMIHAACSILNISSLPMG
jgi:hypothetical protein